MWILPKQLHTSPFVPDTAALISDSTEQSEICAQSLLARSKPSPARTWSQRWKRDSWTQHLSGRILKPSHGPSFVTAWTSSLAATRASHSAQPASGSEPKTPDTSGLTYQPELLQCDQVSVSLKTSRDISALGYPTLSKTWTDWVTERRGAWRQRVNAVRLTRGSGSSSWPTMHMGSNERGAYYDKTGKGQRYLSDAVVDEQKNWPSPVASEVRQGFQDRSKGMKGSQESLTTVVMTQEAAKENWLTPQSGDVTGSTQDAVVMWANGQRPKTCDQRLRTQVAAEQLKHGQAAPASPNTLGSRQGLSWMTPRACEAQNPPMGVDKRHHGLTHQVTKQWGTPAANDANKTPHCEVNSNQAGLAKSVGLELQRQWATPRTPTGGPESAQRKQELGRTTSGGGDLASQASGKLSSQWVCTLMGLPMGWVSPSCPASVIKNWPRFVTGWLQATTAPTSCDSSETALCRPAQSERSDFFLAS
jgi:hypothetical protein